VNSPTLRTAVTGWALSVLAATFLIACGGGGVGSNGTGAAPAPGLSFGTVTGFGSVIIDGARFDDTAARVTIEREPGLSSPTETRLGQAVEIDFDPDQTRTLSGVAREIHVDPALAGPVDHIGAGALVMLGQTVVINADPTVGPVTVFEPPYAALVDVRPGDWVEIHGMPLPATRTPNGQPGWLATRIEKHVSTGVLRIRARVSQLVEGQGFDLGTLHVRLNASTRFLSGNDQLSAGQIVTVFALEASFAASSATAPQPSVLAHSIRIRDRLSARVSLTSSPEEFRSGVIESLTGSPTSGWRFEIDGVPVVVDATTQLIPPATALVEGLYLRVQGRFVDTGELHATVIEQRGAVPDNQIELYGTLLERAGMAISAGFLVRDVAVDASSATIDLSSCTSPQLTALAAGLYVEVHGRPTPDGGVRASRVICKNASMISGAVIEALGTITAMNSTLSTLNLQQTDGATLHVRWTGTTYFRDVSLSDPPLTPVKVEGVVDLSTGAPVLVATKIKLAN
jgi:hypothetical protein